MAAYRSCPVCSHRERTDIELAYMTGERMQMPFSRAVIERHMAHVTEPEALKIALGLSATTALAARLRHLESQATTILDMAMAPTEDGKALASPTLALKAMREVRATMELMGRVAGTLVDRVQVDNARPDLDSAIADALAARGFQAPAGEDEEHEQAQPLVEEPLALGPGDAEEPEAVAPGPLDLV